MEGTMKTIGELIKGLQMFETVTSLFGVVQQNQQPVTVEDLLDILSAVGDDAEVNAIDDIAVKYDSSDQPVLEIKISSTEKTTIGVLVKTIDDLNNASWDDMPIRIIKEGHSSNLMRVQV